MQKWSNDVHNMKRCNRIGSRTMRRPSAFAWYRSELAGSIGRIFLRSLSPANTELMCLVNVIVSALIGAETLLNNSANTHNAISYLLQQEDIDSTAKGGQPNWVRTHACPCWTLLETQLGSLQGFHRTQQKEFSLPHHIRQTVVSPFSLSCARRGSADTCGDQRKRGFHLYRGQSF